VRWSEPLSNYRKKALIFKAMGWESVYKSHDKHIALHRICLI
jgi:hypothetical protein